MVELLLFLQIIERWLYDACLLRTGYEYHRTTVKRKLNGPFAINACISCRHSNPIESRFENRNLQSIRVRSENGWRSIRNVFENLSIFDPSIRFSFLRRPTGVFESVSADGRPFGFSKKKTPPAIHGRFTSGPRMRGFSRKQQRFHRVNVTRTRPTGDNLSKSSVPVFGMGEKRSGRHILESKTTERRRGRLLFRLPDQLVRQHRVQSRRPRVLLFLHARKSQ